MVKVSEKHSVQQSIEYGGTIRTVIYDLKNQGGNSGADPMKKINVNLCYTKF